VTENNVNLSASLEDYLEAIFNLLASAKVARSKDIAKSLGVSKASVTGALRLLKKKGLANYKPYDFITLTDDGRTAAAEIVRKHNILKSFFVDVLAIDPATAQKAACSAEHELGPEVIARLLAFIDFVTDAGKGSYDIAGQFSKFWRTRSPGVRPKPARTRKK
jgi:DtxR family Mn-dependent transcriptional regulator